jgi:KipI family sensor histidine kinase inhibitor
MIEPLGDRAFLARFASERDAAAWASAVRATKLPGVTDVVLAYQTAAVHADPDEADLDGLERALSEMTPSADHAPPSPLRTIPVLYDGPDLGDVARRLGLTTSEVIALHASVDYDVFAVGFLMGFPYAGYLPERLAGLPRRAEPRLRVPPGSVAIVGRQTGIYPSASPGGWHLLGRTPLRIADAERETFLIRSGDRIRFQPIDSETFEAIQNGPHSPER